MQKELDNMIRQFPEFRAKILALFNNDEEFKSLCDDYFQCARSVQIFRELKQKNLQVESEYEHLLLELKADAVRYLQK